MTIEYRIKVVNGELIVRQSIEGGGPGLGGNQVDTSPPPGSGGNPHVQTNPPPGRGGNPLVPPDPGPGSGTGIGDHVIVFGPTIFGLHGGGATQTLTNQEPIPDIIGEDAGPPQ